MIGSFHYTTHPEGKELKFYMPDLTRPPHKIQPQPGLGDTIFALPEIKAMEVLGVETSVVTNFPEVLRAFGLKAETVSVEVTNGFSKKLPDYKYLRYGKYQGSIWDMYYTTKSLPLETAVGLLRESFQPVPSIRYSVYAPPRAAARHRDKTLHHERFECTPNVKLSNDLAKTCINPLALICDEDVYHPNYSLEDFKVIQAKTLLDLLAIIAGAEVVISQVSAITAMAGLFGKPTVFLPAELEPLHLHQKHVEDLVWPGQKIIKQ